MHNDHLILAYAARLWDANTEAQMTHEKWLRTRKTMLWVIANYGIKRNNVAALRAMAADLAGGYAE